MGVVDDDLVAELPADQHHSPNIVEWKVLENLVESLRRKDILGHVGVASCVPALSSMAAVVSKDEGMLAEESEGEGGLNRVSLMVTIFLD